MSSASRRARPRCVTFHANGGVGADYTQNFYGRAALNPFTKADGVFAGWATTPDGEVAYTDGAKLSPAEAMDLRRLDAGVHRHLCL